MEKYILTGGPGVGKTTILKELEKRGYNVIPEAARSIIAEEVQKENGIVPWTDLYGFQKLVVAKQRDLESKIKASPTFLDRGVVDGLAYCHFGNISAPYELNSAVADLRYHGVFILESLPQYSGDPQRKESRVEALQLQGLLWETYLENGYAPISVPAFSVEERVEFILDKIQERKTRRGA